MPARAHQASPPHDVANAMAPPASAAARNTGIVAIIRAPDGSQLVDVCQALVAGGIDVMEVTFTVPKAHRVLEEVASKLGDKVLLGAGTVLDTETARIAMLAGAEFIVSPVRDGSAGGVVP